MSGTNQTRNRVRLAFDMLDHDEALCAIRAATARVWRGCDLQVEVGLFFDGTIIDSFTNLATLYLDIVPYDDRDGAALVSKSLVVGDLDVISGADWTGGTAAKCNALFEFTKEDMQLDMTGATENRRSFWLVCYAVTTDTPTRYITYGAAQLIVEEDGAQNGIAVTSPLPASWRIKETAGELYLQIYNPTSGKWHTITCTGADGAQVLGAAAGET
jgi:hypothetical protein